MNRLYVVMLICGFVVSCPVHSLSSEPRVNITPDGSGQGNCATNPHTPLWFNSAANWGDESGKIGPGTAVVLCGTFTGPAGATEFTFQGSGSVGKPITLLFDANTQLNAPYWGYHNGGCGGAICIYKRSYVTIDGGSNGIIQNTSNGDVLNYQHPSEGIEAFECNHCVVENLTIANIYVHLRNGKDNLNQTTMRCISLSGSDWSIHGNTMHDAGWCLFHQFNSGDGDVSIFNNKIYNIDHGWMLASYRNIGGSSGPFTFHDNQVSGFANWDTASNSYHHDGIHCFTSGTNGIPSHITKLSIYNNLFGGPVGDHMNSHIFIEGGTGPNSTPCADRTSAIVVYNNAIISDKSLSNGLLCLGSGSASIYNNTLLGWDASKGICFVAGSVVGSVKFENNAVERCNVLMLVDGISFSTDNNAYGDGSWNSFVCNKKFLPPSAFSTWKSCVAGDRHSSYSSALPLGDLGIPRSHSAVVRAGANLTSLGINSLDSDTSVGGNRTPVSRPANGAWDVGAYEVSGSK